MMTSTLVLAIALVLATFPVPAAAAAEHLVDVEWLRARLGRPDLRVVDMVSEPEDYQKEHVPGAFYLHVNDARMGVPAGGFRLPTVTEAEKLLGALAIGRDTHVVIYDDVGGVNAARLFFTLDVLRHPKVSLLDGGVQAWRAARQPLTTDLPAGGRVGYRPVIDPARVVDAAWIRDHLGDPSVVLVDARTPAEFAGTDVRARRGGHIPGAVNVDWKQHLAPDGRLKPLPDLRALFTSRGVTPDRTVVTYCQTHHRAAHTYFVLRLLGYPRVAGYDRSWVEWGNREDLPIARP
jgi:thiosulfate/3-mercaptopyruvate sulfurtransferase